MSAPRLDDYMRRFEAALRADRVAEWSEIASDVRSHIAEAESVGKTRDAAIDALGPPKALARAYAVELLMHAPNARRNGVGRYLKLAGLLIAGSFLTFIVAGTLGLVGVSFTLLGLMLFVVTLLEAAGVHVPYVQIDPGPLPPLVVMMIGPLLFVIGWAALWGFRAYLRLLARVVRRALPTRAVERRLNTGAVA